MQPPGGASSSAVVWNVCAGDLFDDLEPDETNTAFKSAGSQDDDAHSVMSSSVVSGTGSMASSAARDGPFPWGKPLEWIGVPPGLEPPAPPGTLAGGAPATVAGKAALWDAAGDVDSVGSPDAAALGKPGTPMVLWCEAKPTRQAEVMQALAGCFEGQRPQFVHFPTPARFTRWLFEQPRGDVTPWALLVVGWREAKPSAMAIGAARTGDASPLRPDARRPTLQPLTGTGGDQVQVAIESMIIVLEKPEHEDRVQVWAQEGGKAIAGLDVFVASDDNSLNSVVANLRLSRSTTFVAPVGRVTLSL